MFVGRNSLKPKEDCWDHKGQEWCYYVYDGLDKGYGIYESQQPSGRGSLL